jgi:hypothetical protein
MNFDGCSYSDYSLALSVLYKSSKYLYEGAGDDDVAQFFKGSKAYYAVKENKAHVNAKLFFRANITTQQLENCANNIHDSWGLNTTVLANYEPGAHNFGDVEEPKKCTSHKKRSRQLARRLQQPQQPKNWTQCAFCEKDMGRGPMSARLPTSTPTSSSRARRLPSVTPSPATRLRLCPTCG